MLYFQEANTQFTQAKSSNQSGAQREQLLKDLASGFDNYMELKSNLEEGTKVTETLPTFSVHLTFGYRFHVLLFVVSFYVLIKIFF